MKKINIRTVFIANYLGFLLQDAKIVFSRDKRYKDFLSDKDKALLKKNEKYLNWGNGFLGDLTSLLIFFPIYLEIEDISKLENYCNCLKLCMKTKSYDLFKTKYKKELENLNKWTGYVLPDFNLYQNIVEIFDVFVRNFELFKDEIYLKELPLIKDKISAVQKEIDKYDFIGSWEDITKIKFLFENYDIILGMGIFFGPNANSLSYEKNWFSYDTDIKTLIPFICHETGTHISINLILSVLNEMQKSSNVDVKEFNYYYQGYESLITFYNAMVVKKMKLPLINIGAYSKFFDKVYQDIKIKNPHLTAVELFHYGVESFKKSIK